MYSFCKYSVKCHIPDITDEKLSYSELKDRIREEVTSALPKKEQVMLLAKKLEDGLTIKDTICDQICTDFKDLISESYRKVNGERKERNPALLVAQMTIRMFQNKLCKLQVQVKRHMNR
jgi:hypothetical protein